MSIFLFANNAKSALAAPISSGATIITLTAGTGSLFPSPGPSQQFALTLTPASTPTVPGEIVYCTGRTGDTLTVIRGQEATTPTAYGLYDLIANLWTAGSAGAMIQTATFIGQYEVPFFNPYGSLPATSRLVNDTPVTNFAPGVVQSVFWNFQIFTSINLSDPIKLEISYTGDVTGNDFYIQFEYQNLSTGTLTPTYVSTNDSLAGPSALGDLVYYQTVTAIIPAAELSSEGIVNCILSRLGGNVNDTNTGNLQIINITMGQ